MSGHLITFLSVVMSPFGEVRGGVGGASWGWGQACGARLSGLLCCPVVLSSRMARAISLVSRGLEVWKSEWVQEA